MTRQEFVEKYGAYVKSITSGTGIFPETLFAQAILESSHGADVAASELAKKYNNLFGIKADNSWNGKSVNMKTGEFTGTPNAKTINDYFRVYNAPEDSIADYVRFLKSNPRYANAGVFNAKNPQEQANLLQKAGYATGAGYGKLVGDIAHSVSGWLGGVEEAVSQTKQKVEDAFKQTTDKISETATETVKVIKQNPVILVVGTVLILTGIFFFYKYNSSQQTT